MKSLLVVLLCFLLPASVIGEDSGFKVGYDGGSVPDMKTGASMKLVIAGNQIQLIRDKKEILSIPAASITEVSYGQDVHRRVGAAIGLAVFSFGLGALLALSKSKKHFVGITWVDGDKKGGFVVQADKSDYRGLILGLEGVTGKKAIDSDAMTVKN
jgi:hypothetical protein